MNKKVARAKVEFMAEPCRNFNILGSSVIIDPIDGKEKLVFSNFAAGTTGNLIFIDTQTGEGEALKLPGDEGAWAIMNLNNEKLLIGTCAGYGYLHCLDLKSRIWAEPLRDKHEKYIWNLTLGSDGMIYGGTYPGCVLLRYDPLNHTLENMGKASDNPKDLYSRNVSGELPGYILISGGLDKPFLSVFNIKDRTFRTIVKSDSNHQPEVRKITDKYIEVAIGKELNHYDTDNFNLISGSSYEGGPKHYRRTRLKDGRIAGTRGQEYFIKENEEDKPKLKKIPTSAPATHIHTIVSDSKGVIWGASSFGQTIFYYDPKNNSYWNSPIVCNGGGEVYGMAFSGENLYLTAYSGGEHIVYNPTKPWDQLENINPKTIARLTPTFIRPLGRSVVGPDGAVWTGWSTEYGVYGGGLSRIDTVTHEVSQWYDPVKEQQIISVSADYEYIYFTTNSGGNGLPLRGDPSHFVVWTPDGRKLYEKVFEKEDQVGVTQAAGGKALVAVGNKIHIFDPVAMDFVKVIDAHSRVTFMLRISSSKIIVFCTDTINLIDLLDIKNTCLEFLVDLPVYEGATAFNDDIPGMISTAAITPDGDIYFGRSTILYKLNLE